jgi:hypothetical protein
VDEPADEFAAVYRAGVGDRSCRAWRRQVETSMRSTSVVVRDVLAKDHLEVTVGKHEYVVEAVFAKGV